MIVVILAGGRGIRMLEETKNLPKPLVEIGEKPIIWHIMKYFSCFGFNDFIVCTGYKSYLIKEFYANYCDIKLANFPQAITHYETIILNPESEADSVFAVIDAGYAYLLMEDRDVQYIGRIQWSEKPPVIFDHRDVKIDYFEKMFKQRNRY